MSAADKLTFSQTSDISAFVANIEKLNNLRTGVKLEGVQGQVAALIGKVGQGVDASAGIKMAPRSIDAAAVTSADNAIA